MKAPATDERSIVWWQSEALRLQRALDDLIEAHGQRRFPGVRWSIDVDPYDMF